MQKFLRQIYKLSLLLICMLCSNSLFATTASVNIGEYATANSWVNGTKYESIALDANVTATVAGTDGNTGKYYTAGNQWRLYQTGSPTLTISTTSGTLSSVTVTYAVDKGGVLLNGSTAVASGTAVTASGSSITFNVGNSGTATNGQVRVTAISVEYTTDATAIATPVISGTTPFLGSTEVTIACSTDGASIYYTLNGDEPTTASTAYTGPFTINATATVKAIAISAGTSSSIAVVGSSPLRV